MHGNIMPWIIVNGCKINFDMGMTAIVNKNGLASSKTGAGADDKTVWGWWLSPYIKFGPLEAGVQIMTIGVHDHLLNKSTELNDNAGWGGHKLTKDAPVKVAIPIRMVFHF